jgi:hypothetical protein
MRGLDRSSARAAISFASGHRSAGFRHGYHRSRAVVFPTKCVQNVPSFNHEDCIQSSTFCMQPAGFSSRSIGVGWQRCAGSGGETTKYAKDTKGEKLDHKTSAKVRIQRLLEAPFTHPKGLLTNRPEPVLFFVWFVYFVVPSVPLSHGSQGSRACSPYHRSSPSRLEKLVGPYRAS